VAIAGANFGATQGSGGVTFNGTAAAPTGWSNTSIVVPVPSGAITGNVVVNASGLTSNFVSFTVTVPAPSITSLSPSAGPVGASVVIAGANFGASQGSSTVTFNGAAATPTGWSDDSIVVPVPSGATSGNIVVTTAGGQATSDTSFTVTAAGQPTIQSLSPTSGPEGTSVTITGTDFGATQGTSTVTFNGITAALLSPSDWSDTTIVVPVPSGVSAGKAAAVVIVNGQSSNSVDFTVTPQITRLSLPRGPVQMGFMITGSNFGATQGGSEVRIGTTLMNVVSWNDLSITVQVPAGASTGNVVVRVNGAASNGVNFTVVEPFGCQ
jgi:hypothetical protein